MDKKVEDSGGYNYLTPDDRTAKIWYISSQRRGIIEGFCPLECD